MSLRELGARTDLTAGFLSQVENDKVAPSLNSLQRIAAALDVPMFRFLDGAQTASPIIRAGERTPFLLHGWNTSYDVLTAPTVRAFMVVLVHLQPGTPVTAQKLVRPTEEWMMALEGQVEVRLEDATYTLQRGDTLSYQGTALRQFAAVGGQPAAVVCCIAPPVL
ncbi:MAG: helix-turn-helix domain-containing protein [Anaerolineales bacterium]|nr:helix-turn-helix domain-containing protein [Anaerolineales bacterium]